MYKVDLHTHSIISYDGGITKKQYVSLLEERILDCVAITDHNETKFARVLHKELGSKIIVGEEIKTLDGEIIGLFLQKTISSGLTASETISQIHQDGGLVYIPHPFEKGRDSLQEETIETIIEEIDIIEIFNARGVLRGKPKKAYDIAVSKRIAMASSSDAHCRIGIGTSFSSTKEFPKRETLLRLLNGALLEKRYASLISLLCPAFNKVKNNIILKGTQI